MQNYSLLKAAGRAGKPVLLKRGMAATLTELLLSAEYILAEGNHEVILCERGVRGFDPATRNIFDLTAIPMARAAVAAGADGIIVEVHPDPAKALSDGAQSLYPQQFSQLMREVRVIAEVVGRRIAEPVPAAV